MEDGAEVAAAEAVVEVGLELLVEEDGDAVVLLQQHVAQGLLLVLGDADADAPHPQHARRQVERLAVEDGVVVPRHLEAARRALVALDVERQLVRHADHRVAPLQGRLRHQRHLVGARLLLVGRQLEEVAERERRRPAELADEVGQVPLQPHLPLLDHRRVEAVEHVRPQREVRRQLGQVHLHELVQRAEVVEPLGHRPLLPLVQRHHAVRRVHVAARVALERRVLDREGQRRDARREGDRRRAAGHRASYGRRRAAAAVGERRALHLRALRPICVRRSALPVARRRRF